MHLQKVLCVQDKRRLSEDEILDNLATSGKLVTPSMFSEASSTPVVLVFVKSFVSICSMLTVL